MLSNQHPSRVAGLTTCMLSLCYWYMRRSVRRLDRKEELDPKCHIALLAPSSKVGVNARFLKQMRKLLPVCIPGVFSKEAGLLASLAIVLIARTWLDIWFSGFNGSVVKAIVSRDKKTFIAKAVIEFGLFMWPLSFVNNSLKLCISSLSLAFRARLTKYAHEHYFHGMTFYKVASDTRLQNPDQLLTQDIDKFSDSLSHLYSDIAKPLVDIFLFAYKLGEAIGRKAPFYMIGYFVLSGYILRSLSPPFGKYTATEQKLEGDYRFTHSRILTHSEEIAFYNGAAREKILVNASFDKIVHHLTRIIHLRFANGLVDSIFVKYLATMLAYFLLARPVMMQGDRLEDATRIMEDYSRNSGYLVNLSQAVGRILLAGRDLTRFAGYTSRVSNLFHILESNSPHATHKNVIFRDHVIAFEDVPIVTPAGDVLVPRMSFRVEAGMNCLITGCNGCGKSSLFRILGGLWPLHGGKITKPPNPDALFYVPQKPYLALGTLRDQVIYPHSPSHALTRGFDDRKLLELLGIVRLAYLVEREGGFDAVQDWASALSGGEKQRIAMARLFYHQPQFAILDECTSAVSVDVEGIMYEHARRVGITLFTVSHRTSLFKYHEYLLRFDGEGHYEFLKMDPEGKTSLPFAFASEKVEKKTLP